MGSCLLTSWGLDVKRVMVVFEDETVNLASSAHSAIRSSAAVRLASSSSGVFADSRALKSSAKLVMRLAD